MKLIVIYSVTRQKRYYDRKKLDNLRRDKKSCCVLCVREPVFEIVEKLGKISKKHQDYDQKWQ